MGKTLKNRGTNAPSWDKKICNLNISDIRESSIELRIDVSSQTPGDSWNLQCEIREKLIRFIQENYARCLPVMRIQTNNTE